jgi:hypothetical protein
MSWCDASPLCRPSGNLIASVKTPPIYHRHEVALFERNGLQHGEFVLRSTDEVLALQWNCESDILAILLRSPHVCAHTYSIEESQTQLQCIDLLVTY